MRHQAYIERDSACIHSHGTIAADLDERTRLWSELGARAIHRAGHLRAHADTDQRLRHALRSLAPAGATDPEQVRTTADTHDAYLAMLQRLAEDVDLDGEHGLRSRRPRSSTIQYRRIILELPHQLDPYQAATTLDAWCDAELTQHGIAFHAAIHQPEHGNDPRNWHAHVVFPTVQLQRADTNDRWTFEQYSQKFPPSLRPRRLQVLPPLHPSRRIPQGHPPAPLRTPAAPSRQLGRSHQPSARTEPTRKVRYVARSPTDTPSGTARHHGPPRGHGWPLERPELRLAAGLATIGFHPGGNMALQLFGRDSKVPAPAAADPQTSQYDPVDAAIDSFIHRTAQAHQALLRLWRQERQRLRRRDAGSADTELHDDSPNLAIGHAAHTVTTLFRTGVLANLAADGNAAAREIRQTARAWRAAIKPYNAIVEQARESTSRRHARDWRQAHRSAARALREFGLRDFPHGLHTGPSPTPSSRRSTTRRPRRGSPALERRRLELAADPGHVTAAAAARTEAAIDPRTGEFDTATPTLTDDVRLFLETSFRAAWLRRERAARDPDAHFTDRSTDPHWTLGLSLPERADLLARRAPDVSITRPGPTFPATTPPPTSGRTAPPSSATSASTPTPRPCGSPATSLPTRAPRWCSPPGTPTCSALPPAAPGPRRTSPPKPTNPRRRSVPSPRNDRSRIGTEAPAWNTAGIA